jgi:glyoxylase-like metal-dependent hydrolase (beta-lactamase superfamily II)
MRIRTAGKICDGLWFLGREESCVYLLEGEREAMILSGGMSYIVPDILEQLRRWGIDEERITKLLILHSHFDHVGIVPFFKRRNPNLEIYASARGWEILGMPKAIATINEFSRDVARRLNKEDVFSRYDLEWRDDVKGMTVGEGDRLELGGLEVHILETPGHSSCSITAYVPRLKALFASDGGGIPFKETIIPSGNSNFTKYQQSLEKLKDLDVDFVCADHYGYVTGGEARGFIRRGIELAARLRSRIEEVYLQYRDVSKAAKTLVEEFYRVNPDYFLSPSIYEGVYGQMVRHIAQGIEQQEAS